LRYFFCQNFILGVLYNMVEFYLTELNKAVTLGTNAEIPESYTAPATGDVGCRLRITSAQARTLFKFQTDSSDVTDVSTADMQFFCYPDAFSALTNNGSGNADGEIPLNISDANIISAHGSVAEPEKGAMVGHEGVESKNLLQHDWLRRLAVHTFNTEAAVDLFTNEEAMRTEMHESVATTVGAHIVSSLNIANGKNSGDASDRGDANLMYKLFEQLGKEDPTRLVADGTDATIQDMTGEQPFPFNEGDSISIFITLTSKTGQKDALLNTVGEIDMTIQYKLQLLVQDSGNTLAGYNYSDDLTSWSS